MTFATAEVGALLTEFMSATRPDDYVVYDTTDGGTHWQWTVVARTPPRTGDRDPRDYFMTPWAIHRRSEGRQWVLVTMNPYRDIVAEWPVATT